MASWDRITAVYMLANHKNGTLYIGVSSDLLKRMHDHREALTPGFATRYGCRTLVWYEPHQMIAEAIRREKSLKSYRRKNKISLIEADNPEWLDLYAGLISG